VDDQLTGLGKKEHDFRLYFNFSPGELKSTGGNNYQYTTPNGTVYNFVSLMNEGITSVYLEGSEDPIGGWVSYGYSVRSPIPQIYLASKGPVPLRFVTVIAPKEVNISGSGDLGRVVIEIEKTGTLELLNEDIHFQKA